MILVTGHKGYIGAHLYKELKSRNLDVIGIDLKDGEDILDCLPSIECEYVFHFAAKPRVEFSVLRPSYTLKHNVLVTSKLLEWAHWAGCKRVMFSSSSSVVGDGNGPTHPYGLHKLMSEMECKLYSELYGLDTVCLRYFNAYSEDQTVDGPYATAIAAWMECIRSGKPLRLDGDGEQSRDLSYVSDIVSANIFCMESKDDFSGQTYDVGTGRSVTLNYIKSIIEKYHDIEWSSAPPREGDVRHTCADPSKFKDLGWEAKVSIDEGLERCFNREII